MELVRDTPLEVGFLFWPVRPPRASMLVVVKATYALEPGTCALAEVQMPVTGELHWEDDPEQSVRYPSDFALLKPRGECFVIGCARPLTGRPEERTQVGFAIGKVQKRYGVVGDRAWQGSTPTRPLPFTEMPLRWERALGGPGHAANPMGRGLVPDADGVTWLPNLELDGAPIASPSDRPAPAGSFALGPAWPARRALTGTYDDRWRATRWPWLPEDFRFAWFNEAPADQQIDGYWSGGETIELVHLHPRHPRLTTELPRLRARAFVERAADARTDPGGFTELALSCDTITVDADAGVAQVVWRGALELDHDRLEPLGLARLFVMHEASPVGDERPASAEACRARMLEKLARDRAALDAMAGVAPPPMDAAPDGATLADDTSAGLAAEARRAIAIAQAEEAAAAAPDPLAGLAKLEQELALAGIDVKALSAAAEASAPALDEPLGPGLLDRLEAAFGQMGRDVPEELRAELAAALAAKEEADAAPAPAPVRIEPVDLRARAIALHAKGLPLEGDYTGANLAGLDLRGLDARGAVLSDASFRGANLTGAKLDDAVLIRADFLSASLERASLRKADLTHAVLEAARFEGAKLERATLAHAEAQEAVFDRAALAHADLTGADLTRASFVAASCDEAVLNQAKLAGARFLETSLHDARLYGASAPGTTFERARLDKLRAGRGADLSRCRFLGCSALGASFRGSGLEGAHFERTELDGADFTEARLAGAHLAGCSLRRAILWRSQLAEVSLRSADLYEATMQEANLHRADLRGASLYRVNLFQAYGEGVALDGANLDGTYWERR